MFVAIKRIIACLLAVGLLPLQLLAAEDPADRYLQFYFQIQEAEKAEKAGNTTTARDRYQAAGELLSKIRRDTPNWRPDLVTFRTKYINDKLSEMGGSSRMASSTPAQPPPRPTYDKSADRTTKTQPPLSRTETPLPSSIDDGLQTRVSALERELLKSRNDLEKTRKKLEDVQNELRITKEDRLSMQEKLKKSLMEKEELQAKLKETGRVADEQRLLTLTDEVSALKRKLETAQTDITRKDDEMQKLKGQLDSANKELAALRSGAVDMRVAQLMEENASLRNKLGTISNGDLITGDAATLKSQLLAAKEQATKAEDLNREYEKTTGELKTRLEELQTSLAQRDRLLATNDPSGVKQENALLRGIIDRNLKEQARRDAARKLAMDELAQLKVQSEVIAKQMDILGAPAISLTDKEKALFKLPDTVATTHAPSEYAPTIAAHLPSDKDKSTESADNQTMPDKSKEKEAVPPVMTEVARQGEAYFKAKEYDKAAEKYQEILKHYPENVYALSNLGVVRFQQNKYPEAEESLARAVKYEPQDGFSHSILGIVYYMTQRYDDAINVLQRASVLMPSDGQTRNYLGIAYSQKGWQSLAEQELRKAIELDANYADAHFNLAVVYATQKPPSKELARRHYNQSRSLGLERDTDLEKLLE